MDISYKRLAERFLRGLYGGKPEIVDALGGDNLTVSYPIFNTLFNTPALRGKEAVKKFSVGFSSRWLNPQIVIHESLADQNRVVLLWSFRARQAADKELHQWGGISFFLFDPAGKIIAEIGEESTPGPFARWKDG